MRYGVYFPYKSKLSLKFPIYPTAFLYSFSAYTLLSCKSQLDIPELSQPSIRQKMQEYT